MFTIRSYSSSFSRSLVDLSLCNYHSNVTLRKSEPVVRSETERRTFLVESSSLIRFTAEKDNAVKEDLSRFADWLQLQLGEEKSQNESRKGGRSQTHVRNKGNWNTKERAGSSW